MASVDRPQPDLAGLADLLEPSGPAGSAADIAFAPTVLAPDLPPIPPSSRALAPASEGFAAGLCSETPLAFPVPAPIEDDELPTTAASGLLARVRRAYARQVAEIRELWAGTAEVVGVDDAAMAGATGRVLVPLRRARALWSFWQWGRADIARAAVIGTAVFAAAASVGAAVVAADASTSRANAVAPAADVRVPRSSELAGARLVETLRSKHRGHGAH